MFLEEILPLLPVLVPFLLVVFRVAGLFVFVPVFANPSIPGNVRVMLAVALSLCVFPVVPRIAAIPSDLVALVLAMIAELMVGLLIGTLVSLIFSGVQVGCNMISQQMGLSMATIYDPMFDEQSTVIQQLGFWLSLVVFLSLGGQRELIRAVVWSYHRVPMGQMMETQMLIQVIIGAIESSFELAIKVAIPALAVFFLTTMTMGFISRSMPQISLMTIGMPLGLIVGMSILMVGLAGWSVVIERAWLDMFAHLARILE